MKRFNNLILYLNKKQHQITAGQCLYMELRKSAVVLTQKRENTNGLIIETKSMPRKNINEVRDSWSLHKILIIGPEPFYTYTR